jgi:hypothetical protein
MIGILPSLARGEERGQFMVCTVMEAAKRQDGPAAITEASHLQAAVLLAPDAAVWHWYLFMTLLQGFPYFSPDTVRL